MSNIDPNNLPTYDQAVFAANTAQEIQTERESGVIDRQYIKGIPGLLKALEVGFSLIAFICVTLGIGVCAPWIATPGFFNFVAMTSMILTVILYVILLLKLQKRIFRCECVKWPLLEMGFYGGILIFYFFAALFLSIGGCIAAYKAGAAFGWFAFFAYLADGGLAMRRFLEWRKEQGQPATVEGGLAHEETVRGVTTDTKY